MREIRAFVGHSFSADDQDVVRKFLEYFDQISGLLPHFSWTHAQHAEPVGIVDKVMSLIDDRNTFIAIVTKKERVATPVAFTAQRLRRNTYSISGEKLEWKTSDWVIQEIGLAIGRGLSLILLVEDGCRRPGALDGNVEFIPFRREAPSDAFGPLLEMLTSLSPPANSQGGQAAAESPEPEKPIASSVPSEGLVPEPSWGRGQYEGALIRRIIGGETAEADAISAAYLSTPEGQNPQIQAEWNAQYELWKIIFDQGGSVQRIKQQLEIVRTPSTLESYGGALSHFGASVDVGDTFLQAADMATATSEKMRLLGRAALSYTKSATSLSAARALNEMRSIVCDKRELEVELLNTICDISEEVKDWELWLEATERLVEIDPDSDERFQLAYRHAEEGRNDLALVHYTNIPFGKRSDMAWNNLGVSLDHFKMPSKSVAAYSTAAGMGSSLAMSNIAYKYMASGFVERADEMFQKGLDATDPHPNAAEGLAKLRRLHDEESAKLTDIINGSKLKADFYRRLGRAISAPPLAESPGYWRSSVTDLEMTIAADRLVLHGAYEQSQQNALSFGGSTVRPVKRTVRYEGTIVGRRAAGVVKRTSDAPSFLAIGNDGDEFAMIFEEDGRISVMENPKSSSPTFYELVRI